MSAAFYFDAKALGRPWEFDLKSQALSGTDTIVLEVAAHFVETNSDSYLLTTSAPMNSSVKVIIVSNLLGAVQECVQRGIATLVFVAIPNTEQLEILRNWRSKNVRLVAWAHNTPSFEYLTAAYRCSSFFRLIAVSNVQAYEMAHHPIFNRICVVPNFLDFSFWNEDGLSNCPENTTVSFVGALKPSKGFHLLANIWPDILAKHPNSILKVCGSPGLYGRTGQMGKYGIAESDYEKKILDPLGGSLDSARAMGVSFLGSVTKQELRIQICKSRLVVVNPNTAGSIETFCVSAAESLAMGVPVVGGSAGGLLEVVGHEHGGLLAANHRELFGFITTLIEQPMYAASLGHEGQRRTKQFYSKEHVLERWSDLLANKYLPSFTPHHRVLRPKNLLVRSLVRMLFPLSIISGMRGARMALLRLNFKYHS